MPPTQSPNPVRSDKPPAQPGKPIPVVHPVKPSASEAAKPDDLAPPDEKFWQRYSPNGEPFLSGLSSFVVHGVVLLIILVGLSLLAPKTTSEEIEPVLIGDGVEGGGGGNVQGQGAGPQLSKKDDVSEDLTKPKDVPTPDTPKDDVKVKTDTTPKLADDPDAISLVDQRKQKKPPSAGVFLKEALEGITGKGGGGTGWGGGTGSGVGTGIGDKDGPGTGKSNRRGRRVLRWTVNFNTQS